ncbi:uncharacterized protein B0T23DRAFT_385840 [Neurospora hispaniola]|uniref:Secreted protein n=1 Tax=Neurospora hispaniola TaxID=588809 RepID=A0AAJ0I160_9PEZI|nr:hypothetical protein B0T23DRAFT_385840 [Neurospora hispaniola]
MDAAFIICHLLRNLTLFPLASSSSSMVQVLSHHQPHWLHFAVPLPKTDTNRPFSSKRTALRRRSLPTHLATTCSTASQKNGPGVRLASSSSMQVHKSIHQRYMSHFLPLRPNFCSQLKCRREHDIPQVKERHEKTNGDTR